MCSKAGFGGFDMNQSWSPYHTLQSEGVKSTEVSDAIL